MGTIQTIQELNKKSLQFINKITEAKNKITKPVKKRKHFDANGKRNIKTPTEQG